MCYTSFRVHNVRPSPPPPYLTDARSLFYHCTFFYVPRQDVKKLLAPILKAKSFLHLVWEHKRRYNGNATVKDQFGLIKQKILLWKCLDLYDIDVF